MKLPVKVERPQTFKTFEEIPVGAFYDRAGDVFLKVSPSTVFSFVWGEIKNVPLDWPETKLADRQVFPSGTKIEIVVP